MKEKKSQLKIGIVLNYVNMILGNLIPIFYTRIMLGMLDQNEYGLYKIAGSVTSYLSLISLGIGSSITRYLIKTREEEGKEAEERMLGLFDVIFNVIAVASIVVGTALTFVIPLFYGDSLSPAEISRMQILVFMMVINMALGFSQSPYLSVVSAHEKFIFLQSINILSTVVGPCLNIIALAMGTGTIGMTASSMCISVVVRAIYQIYVRRSLKMKTRYKGLPLGRLKEILEFSFWIFVANVVGQLYSATDMVLIGKIPALAATGAAIYSVGGTFNSIVSSITTGVSNLLAPKVNKMVFSGASGDELTDLSIRVGRIQGHIMSLLVSGFVAFGQPFVCLYAGEDYAEAYLVAICMMIPNLIPLVQSVCLSVIVAQNKHRFRSLVYLGIAISNVIGTWILLHYMGIVGAALMTGISLIIGNGLVMNIYYHKKTGLDMVRFWKELLPVYAIPLVMCVLTLFISRFVNFYDLLTLAIGIVTYTAVFAVLTWFFVMNDYEKNIIRTPIKKFFGG